MVLHNTYILVVQPFSNDENVTQTRGEFTMLQTARYRQATLFLSASLMIFSLFASGKAAADDSSCIVCHTDIELLEENLGEGGKKKSALQTGAG